MADLTFTGTVYNETGIKVDANVDGYTYPQSVWKGSTKATELQEYTINLGDGDWLTNDGNISAGEVVVIRVRGVDGIAAYAHTITEEDLSSRLVVQDVQLKPIQPPTCMLSVAATGTVNNEVSTSLSTSDQYQWEYGGRTHHQRTTWYGTTVFNEIGIASEVYDFGEGYQSLNTYTFTSIGDYTVKAKSTNLNGQESVCQQTIRIKYNEPTGCVQTDPATPLLNADVTLTACIKDDDGRITSIDHSFDTVLEDTNVDLNYSYVKNLDVFKSYEVRQDMHWNDGFEDKTKVFTRTLTMENQPPTVEYTWSNTGAVYSFVQSTEDVDGTVDNLKWLVDFEGPMGSGFTRVYDSGWVGVTDIDLELDGIGNYRVTLIARDNLGATGEYSEVITNGECSSSSGSGGTVKMYFDKE